jgi:hypothetical protein
MTCIHAADNQGRCHICGIPMYDSAENDRLKASNAKLLAALVATEQRISQLCDTVNFFSPGKVRTEDFADKARRVIAEAKGERE